MPATPDPNDPTGIALDATCPICAAPPHRACTRTEGMDIGGPLIVADIPRSHLERRQAVGLSN